MPYAVTHFLFPVIIVSIIRDYFYRKSGKKFPLHYVLIAGLGGVLPDIDIITYLFLQPFGFSYSDIHRTITHSLFPILILVFLGFIFHRIKVNVLGNHKIKLSIICWVLSFSFFIHILLDALITGETIKLLYPFSHFTLWSNLTDILPQHLSPLFTPLLDGILLIIWIIYLEAKHKISDFI